MANVIKHKRGSGSDPSASNLVVGELAIRTDTGKLFTKMDSGAIAEIAGGGSDIAINTLSASSGSGGNNSGVFDDSATRFTLSSPPNVSAAQLLVSVNGVIQKPVLGTGTPSEGFSVDGNDIIFSSPPETGADFFILTFRSLGVSEPADNSVTSAKIVDGAIVNADINASAAIAGTKIDPSFTSNLTVTNTAPALVLVDSDHNSDFNIQASGGVLAFNDSTNSATRISIASDGTVDVNGNLDCNSGLDVTGGITASNTGNASLILDAGTGSQAGNQVSFIDFKLDGTLKANIAVNEGGFHAGDLEINSAGTGATKLFNAGSKKLSTTGTGINVYGSGSTFLELGSEAGATDSVFIDTSHGSNAKPNMDFKLDGDLAMRIDPSGNVGIGTTTPAFAAGSGLEVQRGGVTTVRCDDTAHSTAIEMKAANGAAALAVPTNHPLLLETNGTERFRIDTAGAITNSTTRTQGQTFVTLRGDGAGSNFSVMVFGANSGGHNTGSTAVALGKNSSNSRSLNAAGTVNASGNDYAEYMTKSGDFTIAKGDICGIDANGKLTNKFSESISFVVKSTDPSYVGGDAWGTEEVLGEKPADDSDELAAYEEKYEAARKMVDRIAFSGQVPVNVTGATAGQYIIPIPGSEDSITGVAKTEKDISMTEYMSSVGKVIALESDGRAKIIVKVS